MTDPIRWGVLGASEFARNQMAPAAGGFGHVLVRQG